MEDSALLLALVFAVMALMLVAFGYVSRAGERRAAGAESRDADRARTQQHH